MLKELVPFGFQNRAASSPQKIAQVVPTNSEVARLFRVVSLALGFNATWANTRRTTFEVAPYDFDRIIQATDTDSFVKQAFSKYNELIWKEGWDLVGENDEAVDYVYERIDYMEFAMGRSFNDLLSDISDQLVKFGNCFGGREKFITKEYGPVSFAEVVGERVTVLGADGWTKADVHSFGEQNLQTVTFVPVHPSSRGEGWTRASRSNYRVKVDVTPDHRWILANGSETTSLDVGDVVPVSRNITRSNNAEYLDGLRHGIVFGDGSFDYSYRNSDADSYKIRLCGDKASLSHLFDNTREFRGDIVAYHVSSVNLKKFPTHQSPDYLKGFLDGWILTDGHQKDANRQILTSQDPNALDWLESYAAISGWVVRGFSLQTGDTNYGPRTNPLYRFSLSRSDSVAWRVESIETLPEKEEVFCAVVPDGAAFALASGIYTGNCFLAKARGDLGPFFPGRLTPAEDREPLVGYYVIPAETVEIRRNRYNKVIEYRQRFDNMADGFKSRRQPRWKAEDVIHFSVDRKPGRAFGTPFIISTLDDVIALRQLEEDIQNLVHQELFPLYKYKVGTPEHPAEPHEVDEAAEELARLRSDGGLVLPDRHDVEVIGAENSALDATGYLQHFLTRVVTGLGLSPHHLGIMNEGGNRAVTDRLDIALYDKIKNYQTYLADIIRLRLLSEILMEGGYDPIVHPSVKGESDRVEFRFREIDVDTQVKKETHSIQKYSAGAISLPELRLELNLDPEVEENMLQAAVNARLQPVQTKNADGTTSTQVPEKPDAQLPSKGGRANSKNTTRDVGNKIRPSNQHGRRTSPNIRHADDKFLEELVSLIDDPEDNL